MNDCYFEKKDWRQCKQEVSVLVHTLSLYSERPATDERVYINVSILGMLDLTDQRF